VICLGFLWNFEVFCSGCVFSQSRWTSAASPLPYAAPSFESCPNVHAASFSSTASSDVSGKPGAPGSSPDDATVVSSEEKDEPIQPPFTGDEKGGTGQYDHYYQT
jgi:hypothetical protein